MTFCFVYRGILMLLLCDVIGHINAVTYIVKPNGDDYSVNGPFKTLQAAFNARPEADPVLNLQLSPGTYALSSGLLFGQIDIGKLYLTGTNPQYTIIQCVGTEKYSALSAYKIDELTISGVTFRGCNSDSDGGAVKAFDIGNTTLNNCIFEGNTALNGGAVSITGTTTDTSYTGTITGCTFQSNTADNDGGAIFLGRVNMRINYTTITYNKAAHDGGAIRWFTYALSNPDPAQYSEYFAFSIENSYLASNNASTQGGAISMYMETGADPVTESSSYAGLRILHIINSNITQNTVMDGRANSLGGAIWVGKGTLRMHNVLVTANYAISEEASSFGGGIYVDMGKILLSNCIINGNTADYGGAVCVYPTIPGDFPHSDGYISSCTLSGNKAKKDGGALFLRSSQFLLNNTLLLSNEALGNGGGVYVDRTSTLNFSSTILTSNYAHLGGGGTYCAASNITASKSSIYNNVNNNDIICRDRCLWSGLEGDPCKEACLARDICSVCDGDGSSCDTGCDHVAWSDKQLDVCGICGGNGTTCKGCDGIQGSGKVVDKCGICGGNSTACKEQVCVGAIDQCGVCNGDGSSCSNTGVIAGTTVGSVILIVALGGCLFIARRRRSVIKQFLHKKKPDPLGPDEIDFKEIKFKEEIGSGAFGKVFRGEWRMTPVAIKQIRSGTITNLDQLEEFRAEVSVMKNIRPHPHIVQLLGVCTQNSNELCVVMEFCPNGSLERVLRSNSNIPKELKIRWIKGIAAGMYHLSRVGLVHRDLAARNILLDENLKPKIADFGLARVVRDSMAPSTTKNDIGAIKWLSPESLEKKQYSQMSDVWSFACVCYEIIHHKEPFYELDAVETTVKILIEHKHPDIPDPEQWPIVSEIMSDCFQFKSELRPSFEQICTRLSSLHTDVPTTYSPTLQESVVIIYNN